jgi:cytoskeletal protein RodZ
MEMIRGRRGVKRLMAVVLAVMLGMPGALWAREATGVTQAKERVANTAQQSKSNVQKLKKKKPQQTAPKGRVLGKTKRTPPKKKSSRAATGPMKPMRGAPVGNRVQ